MNKKTIIFVFLALVLSSFVFFTKKVLAETPRELYRVYLEGETIGYIKSKEKLENYIDEEQSELKEKYEIEKVFPPNNLDIMKEITYNQKVTKEEEIYEKIKEKSPFTIKGYIITIEGVEEMTEEGNVKEEDKIIYVLNKELFTNSVLKAMTAFIPEDSYLKFINDTQPEIKSTGTIIEDVYIKNGITLKEGRISTESLIFTDEAELTKYLLFGTLEKQEEYTVKKGDTIEEVAFNNKLSVEEFLIANSQFDSADNLLYEGQKVNLGLIKPAVKYVEEDHVVELETVKYETRVEFDNNLMYGVQRVKQKGSNGTQKVTKKIQKVNGEVKSVVITSTEIVKPVVDKIIVKGNKHIEIGDLGNWAWPTKKPYVITSPYGWRWGKLHEGTDISGTGYGSPIYAANNGTVVEAGYTNINGNYAIINHNNGYYSVYAHMSKLLVKKGQVVTAGQKIGGMGDSGYAFGTHLHFAIFKGYPFKSTSSSVNPLRFY